MQARSGAALLVAATVAIAGPGATALHAGEAPSERGRPSESESPGSRAPDTPPGQESEDPAAEEPDPGTGGATDGSTDGGQTGSEPPGTTGGSSSSSSGGTLEDPGPPPPPEPNLTGTRVLRSSLGPARPDGDQRVLLRDLQVVVTETEAAGIDGGWWVVVSAQEGNLTVTAPELNTVGDGGVPRAREARSRQGGPLFSVTGQRSGQRYRGSYEATGTVGIRSDGTPERPVVTVLLIQ